MSLLPLPLPNDPLALVQLWLDEAGRSGLHNPWAMALSTANKNAQPASRFVLLKQLSVDAGYAVFYTNYGSRKSRELEENAAAAASFYWPDAGRQLRFEGTVVRSPADESDSYFATRPRGSQLNAWASRQSEPLADLTDMSRELDRFAAKFAENEAIPRPEFWGGYRLWLTSIEFWCGGTDRFHERARYERKLKPADEGFNTSAWKHDYVQP